MLNPWHLAENEAGVEIKPYRGVLCLDPGSRMGWSFWDTSGELLGYGAIESKLKNPIDPLLSRLVHLGDQLEVLLDYFQPGTVVYEDVVKGHMPSAAARIWLVYTCIIIQIQSFLRGIKLVPCAPKSMKLAVADNGNAKKSDVLEAVNKRHNLTLKKTQDDEADAIGLGIWYFTQY